MSMSMFMSMKNSSDTIGDQIHDFPACSAVPQRTAPPRTGDGSWMKHEYGALVEWHWVESYYWWKYLSHCHFACHKSQMYSSGSNRSFLGHRTATRKKRGDNIKMNISELCSVYESWTELAYGRVPHWITQSDVRNTGTTSHSWTISVHNLQRQSMGIALLFLSSRR